jgi:pimeloyl-ACP methyl ester carboxylesterase
MGAPMLVSVVQWLLAALAVAAIVTVSRPVLVTRHLAAEAEKKCPPTGKFIEVDGNRIHYVDRGEGRPIVFLHGLGAQLCHFSGPLFGQFGPGYRLIALDRPGSGYSRRARGASGSLSEQARVVRRFIEGLGLERPLVVGHSLGGAVALTLAVEHPGAISGIALLSPLTHMENALRPEFKALYMPSRLVRWIVSYTVAVPRSFKFAEATLDFIFSPQAMPQDYLVEGGGWIGLRPSHFYASSTDFTAIPDDLARIEARYGEIDMPAGLLFGTADRVVAFAEHGAPMPERIRNLDFEVVEGLGHMPHFVERERTVRFVRRIARRAFATQEARA